MDEGRINKEMQSIQLITSVFLHPHLLRIFHLPWNPRSTLLHPLGISKLHFSLCSRRPSQWLPCHLASDTFIPWDSLAGDWEVGRECGLVQEVLLNIYRFWVSVPGPSL